MDKIIDLLESVIPSEIQIEAYLKAILLIVLGFVVIGIIGRLLFGKKSTLNHAVSSAISILFIYIITVVIHSLGVDLSFLVSPLPFISISGDYMSVFVFEGVHYTVLCDQVLGMVILAFLANLADSWLPTGKKLFSWFFFRCISVLLAMVLHLIANAIISAFLPEGLLVWAPVVLLGLLLLLIAVGTLKYLIGTLLSLSVGPLIGILYTFFFSNVVGKQLTKAVLTAAILSGMVWLLNCLGANTVFIAASALVAYIPFLILLLVVWFIIGKLMEK